MRCVRGLGQNLSFPSPRWDGDQDTGPDAIRISTRLSSLWCCVLRIGRDSWSNFGVIHGRLLGDSGDGPELPDGGEGVAVGPDEDIVEARGTMWTREAQER
jgi:hypothetical protein